VNELSSCGQGCKVDSVVTLDSKGHMVLSKDLRERAGLKPNDKIALITFKKEGSICCILMIKAEKLCDPVSKALGSNDKKI
jgi:antitoxin PrlF